MIFMPVPGTVDAEPTFVEARAHRGSSALTPGHCLDGCGELLRWMVGAWLAAEIVARLNKVRRFIVRVSTCFSLLCAWRGVRLYETGYRVRLGRVRIFATRFLNVTD